MLSRRMVILYVRNIRNIHQCLAIKNASYFNTESRHVLSNTVINPTCYKDLTNYHHNLKIIKRFKYNKKPSQSQDNEESDDEDDISDSKNTISTKVNSLRADLILKAGLNMARNKVEAAFYESRIRVNGQKIFKKSVKLNIGDEIDLIRGPSPNNPDFLLVSRVNILSAKEDGDNIRVKLERAKSLVVENYNDGWSTTVEN